MPEIETNLKRKGRANNNIHPVSVERLGLKTEKA